MASLTLPIFAAGAVIRKSGQIPEHIPDAVGAEPVPLRSDPVTGKLGRRGTDVTTCEPEDQP